MRALPAWFATAAMFLPSVAVAQGEASEEKQPVPEAVLKSLADALDLSKLQGHFIMKIDSRVTKPNGKVVRTDEIKMRIAQNGDDVEEELILYKKNGKDKTKAKLKENGFGAIRLDRIRGIRAFWKRFSADIK